MQLSSQNGALRSGTARRWRVAPQVNRFQRFLVVSVQAFKNNVPDAVREAREWVAAYRARTANIGTPTAEPAAAATPAPPPAPAPTSQPSKVTFTLQQTVNFGDCVCLVGSPACLGSWDLSAAPRMTWGEGHVWSWAGELPAGEHELKAVILRANGSAQWETGDNRRLVVPGASKLGCSFHAQLAWGNTAVIQVQAMPEAEGQQHERQLQGEEAAAAATAAEQEGSSGRGSGPVVAAAAFRSEDGASESEEESRAADDYAAPAVSLNLGSSQEAAAEAPVAGAAAGNEMSTAGQVSAAVLGTLAAAVVAWSELALRSTGCGLPPGPGGILGAVEGLSYLTVVGFAAWGLVRRTTQGRGLPGAAALAEVLAYATLAAGLVVLALQVKEYGFIPSVLPDSNCFGASSMESAPPTLKSLVGALQNVGGVGRLVDVLWSN